MVVVASPLPVQLLSEVWPFNNGRFGEIVALWDPHQVPEVKITYRELDQMVQQFGAALQALGLEAGDRVGVIADNSPRWLIADQGFLVAGLVTVPRGETTTLDEIQYILRHSGSRAVVVQSQVTYDRLAPIIAELGLAPVILLSDEVAPPGGFNFSDLLALGASRKLVPPPLGRDQLATIIYTSGTTGQPKGVMLSHGNVMHQVQHLGVVVQPEPGDLVLSILPTWHSYERACEYFLLSRGSTLVYTDRRHIKQDLQNTQPHFLIAVPRIWETVYEGAQRQFREKKPALQRMINFFFGVSGQWVQLKRQLRGESLNHDPLTGIARWGVAIRWALLTPLHRLGDRLVYRKVRQAVGQNFKQAISGGGSLASYLDLFYEIVGIEILNGYGLTETAPVLTARRPTDNVRGTAGPPIPQTEIQICHPDSRAPLPQAATMRLASQQQGVVMARGPQVMLGYYQNPEATAKVLSPEGWFDTGDLGWLTPAGHLVLTGRAKDTIVLTSGENLEPQPLEDAGGQSPYVDQIMVVGQDQKSLAALVYPNLPALAIAQAAFFSLPLPSAADLPAWLAAHPDEVAKFLAQPEVQTFVLRDVQARLAARPSYRPDERLSGLRFVPEPFTMENGFLTQTYKMRRNVIAQHYASLIQAMYQR